MEKIIVIAPFPPQDSIHGNKYSAVASYTKNTLDSISLVSKTKDVEFTVLSDILENSDNYIDGNITVKRCWKRNSPWIYFIFLREILKLKNHKKVIFEFEFGMFGGSKLMIALLPLFILKLKILGKQVYTISHAVILDSSEISGQLGYSKKSITNKIFDFALKTIYFLIVKFSTKVITFEEYLRNKLIKATGNKGKIITIPHGVEEHRQKVDKQEARKILGINNDDFIILNFGFVIWYKGSDWLVDAVNQSSFSSNIKFILAGGFSNVHKENAVYKKYMNEVVGKLESSKNILMTGFLDESKIDLYFSACDLVIFPYRVLISASGPLSFALSHKKPFVLSSKLKGYMDDESFLSVMKKNNISEGDIFFDINNQNVFSDFINSIYSDKSRLKQLTKLSADIFNQRTWGVTGQKYINAIW